MSPVVRTIRSRIFSRLGVAAVALAPACDVPVDAEGDDSQAWILDEANANPADATLVFDNNTSPLVDGIVPNNAPAPAYAPTLSVGPGAVLHPLDLTIEGAPPDSRVRIDIDGPDRSWTLHGRTDLAGTAVIAPITGPILVGGETLYARAEIDHPESLYTNIVSTEIVPADCAVDALAMPGTAANLAEGQLIRVCEELPVDGICQPHTEFHAWRGHDLLVDNMQDVVPQDFAITAVCTETSIVTDCCYVVEADDLTVNNGGGGGGGGWGGYLGRPFSVDGTPVCADATSRTDWRTSDRFATVDLPRRVRRRLARLWQHDASCEHASVASFARLTLELMHLGAPAQLVVEATRAQADEIRHAQTSYALASHFAGAPVGPGALDITGSLDHSTHLEHVLLGAVIEGCIHETICASWAVDAATKAEDPAIAQALAGIADDETRHAELSWDLVRWILDARPELANVAAEAVALFDLGPRPAADPDADLLARGGQLSDRAKHDLGQQVLASVVRPAMASLCHGTALAA